VAFKVETRFDLCNCVGCPRAIRLRQLTLSSIDHSTVYPRQIRMVPVHEPGIEHYDEQVHKQAHVIVRTPPSPPQFYYYYIVESSQILYPTLGTGPASSSDSQGHASQRCILRND
jgi:hypothetical protein